MFTTPGQYSSLETLVGIFGYSVQIYCDFSAYSDIAIGIALLLGFELPDNFNAPYTARLGAGLLAPLAHDAVALAARLSLHPARRQPQGPARTYVNIMVTMLLGGLWHGAGWAFVFWGGLHGVAQVVGHRRRRRAQGARPSAAGAPGSARPRAGARRRSRPAASTAARRPRPSTRAPGAAGAARIGVFAFVTFAWVFFRSATFGAALDVFAQLFRDWGGIGAAVTPAVLLAIAVGIGVQYVPRSAFERLQAGFSVLNPLLQGVALAVGFMLLDVLGPTGPASFLYFQF